ncbi:MAG: H-NS histone family protein, partial [Geminicoccaceae bacterium]|nr:H-NS histone family protein [Geminicoccaceae bacterium]
MNAEIETVETVRAQLIEAEKRVEELRARLQHLAAQEIKKIMRGANIRPEEIGHLLAEAPRRGRRKNEEEHVAYRHPATGQTWSGRGRRPEWVKQHL